MMGSMTVPDRSEVVRRATAGDSSAAAVLWRDHRRWVAAVLLAHKPASAELDDLLQDVAVNMVAKIGGLREPGAFKPWLRTIALNVARSAGRKHQVRGKNQGLHVLAGELEDPESGQRQHREAVAARLERVMEVLNAMQEDYREPLLLRAVEGMTQTEIGEVLGLPVTTVETRLARGRRMLRQAMRMAPPGRKAKDS